MHCDAKCWHIFNQNLCGCPTGRAKLTHGPTHSCNDQWLVNKSWILISEGLPRHYLQNVIVTYISLFWCLNALMQLELRSLALVSFERASLVEYSCQRWSLYLLCFKRYSRGKSSQQIDKQINKQDTVLNVICWLEYIVYCFDPRNKCKNLHLGSVNLECTFVF